MLPFAGREGRLAAPPPPRAAADDAALLVRLRAGDESAFEAVVRAYGGRMRAAARRILADDEEARDAVQDALLAAFRAIGSFEGGARLSTWLHCIAVNAALMKLRTRRRRPEQPIEELLPQFLADGHHAVPPREWADAEKLLARRESCEFVRACIDRLPDGHRAVLVLRDIEELDTAATAELLGLGAAAVKTRLHRARQALRALLAERFEEGR
jgi:RNA polymerase sigma-70 factor (ECF subfamily)